LAGYAQLIALAWQANTQRTLNFAYCNRAAILWSLGQEKPAEEDLRQAIEGWEVGRARISGTGDQRAEYLATQVLAYDRLIRLLADTSRGAEAFEVAERFHARSFLEMLDGPVFGARSPGLWGRRQQIIEELGRLRLDLEEAVVEGGRWSADMARLEGELQGIEARLLGSAEGKPLAEPPSLAQVQAGLRPGEAMVAYWLSEERAFVWVVLPTGLQLLQIPVPRGEIAATVAAFLAPLDSARRAEDAALAGDEAAHIALGRTLYRWLVAPLPPQVRAAHRLIIIPDGPLHTLPFEALVAECSPRENVEAGLIHAPYTACRYLGLEKALVYAASAGSYLGLRQRQLGRASGEAGSLLALAPSFAALDALPNLPTEALRNAFHDRVPLVHAREEAEGVVRLFPGSELRLDQQASEGVLKREAGSFRMLHFATHGLVSGELPMSSGLLLGADRGEDGLLQAHEVLGLELAADLVTLSACSSGRGGLRRGEGIVGLSRAFLAAGASTVVVAQWDVEDRSTLLLMQAFYVALAEGLEAPEAMLEARRSLFTIRGEKRLVRKKRPMAYAHPRYWASFVVLGGGGGIHLP
jgi:CHAT domain-containing protein